MLSIAGFPSQYHIKETKSYNIDFIFIGEKIKQTISKFFGLFGIILFYIPLYYTFINPLLRLFFYIAYKDVKNNFDKKIEEFKQLSEAEKKATLKELQTMNKIFFKFSKELRHNHSKTYKTKNLHKSFSKLKNAFIEIEQECMFYIKEESFEVPETTDKELINILNFNRQFPKALLEESY